MSEIQWEEGHYVLPRKEAVRFRRAVIQAYNERIQWLAKQVTWAVNSVLVSEHMQADSWQDSVLEALRPLQLSAYEMDRLTDYFPYSLGLRGYRPRVPLQKEIPRWTTINRPRISLGSPYYYVGVDSEARILEWQVHANENAVTDAHADWFAQQVFKALYQVQWTRKSGGYCWGGSNTPTTTYCAHHLGPLGDSAPFSAEQ
ncbi:hypothetical protein [Amphritea sp. HPY]|uniref:hypothetical protein n=1 Tax=Amphritea sp. HPY TaxID=3421652 RepID=UPI003D7D4060